MKRLIFLVLGCLLASAALAQKTEKAALPVPKATSSHRNATATITQP